MSIFLYGILRYLPHIHRPCLQRRKDSVLSDVMTTDRQYWGNPPSTLISLFTAHQVLYQPITGVWLFLSLLSLLLLQLMVLLLLLLLILLLLIFFLNVGAYMNQSQFISQFGFNKSPFIQFSSSCLSYLGTHCSLSLNTSKYFGFCSFQY